MQSKMTEREWLAGMEELIEAGEGFRAASLEMSKRAGLEFAQEPAKVPDRLRYDKDIWTREARGSVVPEGGFFEGEDQWRAALLLAVDRYNAYPGLRAAAERVLNSLRPMTNEALGALSDELAKGPK